MDAKRAQPATCEALETRTDRDSKQWPLTLPDSSPGTHVAVVEPLEPRVLLEGAPVATEMNVLVHVGCPKFIVLTGDDSQGRNSMTPTADPLTFEVLSQPQHGILVGNAPILRYIPEDDYQGADSFTYRVSDVSSNSEPATVSLNVQPWEAPIGIP
jgi:hypothetical protein